MTHDYPIAEDPGKFSRHSRAITPRHSATMSDEWGHTGLDRSTKVTRVSDRPEVDADNRGSLSMAPVVRRRLVGRATRHEWCADSCVRPGGPPSSRASEPHEPRLRTTQHTQCLRPSPANLGEDRVRRSSPKRGRRPVRPWSWRRRPRFLRSWPLRAARPWWTPPPTRQPPWGDRARGGSS